MEGKIVFAGETKAGEHFIIRYPQKGDARSLVNYINTLSKEKTYILFQGEQITLDYEINYLRDLLEKISRKSAVHLLLIVDDRIAGVADIVMLDRTQRHKGELGISIAKEFRGQGLGRLLLEKLINEATAQLLNLRIVLLSVYKDNTAGIAMYTKFGFETYGELPEGYYYKGKYVNQLLMFKRVK